MKPRKIKILAITIATVVLTSFLYINNANALITPTESQGTGLHARNAFSKWIGPLHDYEGDITQIGICSAFYTPLLQMYVTLPCNMNSFDIGYGTTTLPGGSIFTDALDKWWVNDAFPQIKKLTSQLSAFMIGQTQAQAVSQDATNVAAFVSDKQELETRTVIDYTPNEYSCVVTSNISALAKAYAVSEEMTESYKRLMERRNISAPNTDFEGGDTAQEKKRWENYCQYFNDPDSNNGGNACTDPQTAGSAMNGDIDIEGVLFKDTIDMTDPAMLSAAENLIFNIVQPHIDERLISGLEDSSEGRETVLKMQHLAAIRNVATHVVSSIIARRAPVSQVNVSGIATGTLIGEIRKNAGIAPEDISANPSYNEIMLALTKERFMDPTYYIKVQDRPSVLVKEQANLEAFINLQLNDIYKIQEQINTLLIARNALKFEGKKAQDENIHSTSTGNEEDQDSSSEQQ